MSQVFANSSKSQDDVLKCIFLPCWMFGFAKYREQSPMDGDIQELWDAQ